jgi:hypothetical protein
MYSLLPKWQGKIAKKDRRRSLIRVRPRDFNNLDDSTKKNGISHSALATQKWLAVPGTELPRGFRKDFEKRGFVGKAAIRKTLTSRRASFRRGERPP